MEPKAGETIFISGGTGSLGAMAIPVAKSFGLTVITNGSAENRDRVLSLGADRFIDYKTEDYAPTVAEVDYVLDTLGDRELPKEFGVLKEEVSSFRFAECPTANSPFARDCPQ